jgi:hypothetical protein
MTQLDPELLAHSTPLTELLGHPLPAGTLWISHPLFNEVLPVPVRPGEEGRANLALAKARERLAEIEKREAWEEAIFEHRPEYRLDAFLRYAEKLTDEEYWRLASVVWGSYTFTSLSQLQQWISVLGSSRPGRSAMMSEHERTEIGKLPTVVRVFRGFDYPNGQRGYSWTLSREVARRFARDGINGGAQMVAEGEIDRDAIIALLLCNGEAEVVANVEHVRIGEMSRV